MGSIISPLRKLPLTPKIIILTLVVGIAAWGILDAVQTKELRRILYAQISEQLNGQSREARVRFDNYVNAHNQAVRLIIAQKRFNEYVGRLHSGMGVRIYREIPPWLPDASVLRRFVHISYAALLDGKGNAIEAYQGRPEPVPQMLIRPSGLLRQLSHNQSLMTEIDGTPFVVTAESIQEKSLSVTATLMLANPLDDDFLIFSQGALNEKNIIALISSDQNRIIASNRPDLLPNGSGFDKVKQNFFVTGKSFFDTGASDLLVQFYSLMPKKDYEEISRSVISASRQNRAIAAVVLIICFSLIMYWITRHITGLSRRMVDFSVEFLGVHRHEIQRGDQLYLLKERFRVLTEEIISAQQKALRDAEEKLEFMRKAVEMEQVRKHEKELEKLVLELQDALTNIKTLRGLLPICAWCKKIRNDQGYWEQVEAYLHDHSDATFTHGICPECVKKISTKTAKKLEDKEDSD